MRRINKEGDVLKSISFGFLHLGIAFFSVAYALTGSVAIAGAITFVEPLANTVAHYFFDRWWDTPGPRAWRQRLGLERRSAGAPEGGPAPDRAIPAGRGHPASVQA
jgi:uncharacterized membrane protein